MTAVTARPAAAVATATGAAPIRVVAHGSPDPRHARCVAVLAGRLRARLGVDVQPWFLEHQQPRLPDVITAAEARAVLPLLFTAGVHWRRDLPPVLAHGPAAQVRVLEPLHPAWFADVVAGQVLAARDRPRTGGLLAAARRRMSPGAVVLASAGSSAPAIVERFEQLRHSVAAILAARGAAADVRTALRPDEIARHAGRSAVVVPVLTADGIFGDRIRAAAAAAGAATTAPLGADPAFADRLAQLLAG